ncbi:hypothetical protein ABKN59_004141 [Abortiporus biennis]
MELSAIVFWPTDEVSNNGGYVNITVVYRGLIMQYGDSKERRPAILKVLYGNRRDYGEQEAHAYQLPKVQALQEQDVFFYKMLEILWFTTMKEQGEVRSKFMATAFQLHNRGLVHGNISSSPVRAPDGSIFFVGLGKMKEEECPCKNVKIEPGFAPSISEFPCKELRRLAITLNIWKPDMFEFWGQQVDVRKYAIPPNIAELMKLAPPIATEPEAAMEASKAITDYLRTFWNDIYHQHKNHLSYVYSECELLYIEDQARQYAAAQAVQTPTSVVV